MARSPVVRAPKGRARATLHAEARRDGWESLTRGLPDELYIRTNPRTGRTEVMAVILNTSTRKLRSQQREVMGVLSRSGIKCYQWSLDNRWIRIPRVPRKQGI